MLWVALWVAIGLNNAQKLLLLNELIFFSQSARADYQAKTMKFLILLVTSLIVCGCATPKEWIPTGGSRSDGVVELSYQYGLFEEPVLDESQGRAAAADSCGAWGFSDARAFGGAISECQSTNGYGDCNSWLVTKKYQCID